MYLAMKFWFMQTFLNIYNIRHGILLMCILYFNNEIFNNKYFCKYWKILYNFQLISLMHIQVYNHFLEK